MKCDEIFAALELLEKERGISPTFMMDKIIQALTTAYKKDHEGVENVIVDVDEAKKDLRMYVQKEIVEEVENPGTQMSMEEARAKYGRVDLGGVVNIPVDNVEFGRIAAGNGKQVIEADIPMMELTGYCTVLRSMTGGRGSFEYEITRYEQTPSDIQDAQVKARASKVAESGED